MEGALTLIGLAAAALLLVAIAVAWWEQTATRPRRAAPLAAAPATSVDVHLDRLAEAPLHEDDQARRNAVLGHAMVRMAQPAPPSSLAWMDTQPIVAPGARAEIAPRTRA